jgi:hypothetical protein
MPRNISCRIFDFYKSSYKILCGLMPEAMGITRTVGSGHFWNWALIQVTPEATGITIHKNFKSDL